MESEVQPVNAPSPQPVKQAVSAVLQGSSPQAREKNIKWHLIMSALLSGILLGVTVFIVAPTSSLLAVKSLVSRYILQADYVVAEASDRGMEWYFARKVKLSRPGFLALFTQNDLGTVSPNALTMSRLIPAGSAKNVQIVIDPVTLSEANVQALWPGSKIFIVLFYDDGDGTFHQDKDIPAINIMGDLIFDELTTR